MTYEEALKVTKKAIIYLARSSGSHKIDLLQTYESALEKQIAKKPKIITTSERVGLQEMICPLCHKFFGERIKGDAILFDAPKYCKRCGQAIDWSDDR